MTLKDEVIRHNGKIAHLSTHPDPSEQTQFNYCGTCRDWFNPIGRSKVAKIRRENEPINISDLRMLVQEIRDETTDGVASKVYLSKLTEFDRSICALACDFERMESFIADLSVECGTLRSALLDAKGDQFVFDLIHKS